MRLYKILSLLGDVKSASRSPEALARRQVRKQANKTFNRLLRKALKP
jgi:hypothetical protein